MYVCTKSASKSGDQGRSMSRLCTTWHGSFSSMIRRRTFGPAGGRGGTADFSALNLTRHAVRSDSFLTKTKEQIKAEIFLPSKRGRWKIAPFCVSLRHKWSQTDIPKMLHASSTTSVFLKKHASTSVSNQVADIVGVGSDSICFLCCMDRWHPFLLFTRNLNWNHRIWPIYIKTHSFCGPHFL